MRTVHLILIALAVILFTALLASAVIGRPLADAQAQQIVREPTALEMQMAIREANRQRSHDTNWPLLLLLVGIVTTLAYLSIGDRTTKLLRAWKSARKPHTPLQPPQIEMVDLQQLPAAHHALRQLPAGDTWMNET